LPKHAPCSQKGKKADALYYRHLAGGRHCQELSRRQSEASGPREFQLGGEDLDGRAVPRGSIDHVVSARGKPGRVNRAMLDGQSLKVWRLRSSDAMSKKDTHSQEYYGKQDRKSGQQRAIQSRQGSGTVRAGCRCFCRFGLHQCAIQRGYKAIAAAWHRLNKGWIVG